MKLLILDDDIQIREGIQNSIDWKSLGIDEVRSAGDGISGLKLAREQLPDIILSDVRMPGMDGLEFLRQVKEFLPLSKVVLISGYDDFEYLRKAIQYGASDYELKPIKVHSLINRVRELQEKIIAENTIQKNVESYKATYDEDFLRNVLNGTITDISIISEFFSGKMKFHEKSDFFTCTVIEIDPHPASVKQKETDSGIIRQMLEPLFKTGHLFAPNHNQFIIVSPTKNAVSYVNEQQGKIKYLLENCNHRLKAQGLSISAGISTEYSLLSLRDGYASALELLNLRSVYGRGSVRCGKKREFSIRVSETDIPIADCVANILSALVDWSVHDIQHAVDIFEKQLKQTDYNQPNYNPRELFCKAVIRSAEGINNYLLNLNMTESVVDIIGLQKELDTIIFIEDIKVYWKELLLNVMDNFGKTDAARYSPKISKAIEYVNAHLTKDLTASALGTIVNLTPNYFSTQFKKEVGMSFNSYVNRSRLNTAAYLLEHTDNQISEIADKTGYHDSIYFSQTFKKNFGFSPSKYRINHQHQ